MPTLFLVIPPRRTCAAARPRPRLISRESASAMLADLSPRVAPELTARHRSAHLLVSGTATTVTARVTLTGKPSATAAIAQPTH